MFPTRYFCNRGFAPRYFCKIGGAFAPYAWHLLLRDDVVTALVLREAAVADLITTDGPNMNVQLSDGQP